MPQNKSDYFYNQRSGTPAPTIEAEENPRNAPTMREGLYQATTAKAKASASSIAQKMGGFGTEYVKPGRKDR